MIPVSMAETSSRYKIRTTILELSDEAKVHIDVKEAPKP